MSDVKRNLLTILMNLKADVLRLNKNEPTEYNLVDQGGICKFLKYLCEINIVSYLEYIKLKNLFKSICNSWPNCRRDHCGFIDPINCVCEYDRYCNEYRNKTQWTNLRRLELLEYSIKYLEISVNA
jgi:hypothetical protein